MNQHQLEASCARSWKVEMMAGAVGHLNTVINVSHWYILKPHQGSQGHWIPQEPLLLSLVLSHGGKDLGQVDEGVAVGVDHHTDGVVTLPIIVEVCAIHAASQLNQLRAWHRNTVNASASSPVPHVRWVIEVGDTRSAWEWCDSKYEWMQFGLVCITCLL